MYTSPDPEVLLIILTDLQHQEEVVPLPEALLHEALRLQAGVAVQYVVQAQEADLPAEAVVVVNKKLKKN